MTFSPVLFQTRTAGVVAIPLAILLTCISSLSRADESYVLSDSVQRQNATLRMGLEKIKLPANEQMAMFGTSYLIEVAPNIYLGPAAYGSVSGKHGGFFTGGGELAWRYKLGFNTVFETGVYVGGGGGGTALVGGGLMLRPHADLMWDFGDYRAGISASNVRFPNGKINSNQIGLVVDFNTEFRHTGYAQVREELPVTERTGVGFDRALQLVGAYKPSKGSTFVSGAPMTGSIGYAGMRMERLVSPNVFVGIEANGAASGGVAGYAEYLGTVGVEMPLLGNRLTLGTRAGLGMGGGGAITVGGGILVKAGVYATANLSRDFHLSLEGGMVDAPNGNFRATYGSLALKWDLDHPYSAATTSSMVANEWVVGTQHYFKAARKDGTNQDVNSLTFKLNRYLSETFYLTGQAHSAYSGQAGGYSVGLMGAGYRTSRSRSGLYAGAEMLAGAAGGGGVDTSGGVVMQPMAYVGMGISKSVSARLSAGRVKSLKGGLNSNVVEFGLSYAYGTTSRN